MDETRVFNPLDLQLSRSVYNWLPHSMGNCLAGRLIPAYCWPVLPGSEFVMKNVHSLFKMATPVYPTMDYLYADIAFFFVPYKLILSRRYASPSVNDADESFEGFIGAQDFAVNMPIPADGVKLPIAVIETEGASGSLASYLYGPNARSGTAANNRINCLKMLSYFAIWNDNYREPNVQTPVTWNYGTYGADKCVVPTSTPQICISKAEVDSFRSGASPTNYVDAIIPTDLGKSTPLPTSVFHGYFGSMLPWPQRNLSGVGIPVAGLAPIVASGIASNVFGGVPVFSSTENFTYLSSAPSGDVSPSRLALAYSQPQGAGTGSIAEIRMASNTTTHNLFADLSQASGVQIEALRALITEQHWYEDIARAGNRIDELEYGTFGVRPKDSGCDRPVYLAGKRIQLNVEMVASTNGGTTSGSAAGSGSLGDLGAFSHTNDEGYYFHHAFDTWGMVMCVFTIRAHNLIASGLDRHDFKETREDFFWPEFANLGNQGIFRKEVQERASVQGFGDQVVGYQEYAEEYRTPRDMVTGLLVPGKSLGFMTYAHYYDGSRVHGLAEVLDASKQYLDVDRTLAVTSDASGFQFIYQFSFEMDARIPVGKYSFPGVNRI